MKVRKKLSLVGDVLRSPRIEVACFGGSDARAIHSYFSSRHPKLPLFRRKTFGAALRVVPLEDEEINNGSRYSQMRRKTRKALKAGYTFRKIAPLDHLDAILRINRSSMVRQGGEMPADYVNRDEVLAEMDRNGDWFGVFGADDRLEAYAYVPIFGEAFVFWKILGNADLLEQGIVYLLVDGTMRAMTARRRETGGPLWGMYDMYIGGGDGLREFKRRTGFEPYRVTWRWTGSALQSAGQVAVATGR